MAQKRLELIYSGRLDQTDFRDEAERFASAHHLTGYVKKLADGRIRVVAEGDGKELQNFLHDFNEYTADFVDHYTKNWFPPTGEYSRFRPMNV